MDLKHSPVSSRCPRTLPNGGVGPVLYFLEDGCVSGRPGSLTAVALSFLTGVPSRLGGRAKRTPPTGPDKMDIYVARRDGRLYHATLSISPHKKRTYIPKLFTMRLRSSAARIAVRPFEVALTVVLLRGTQLCVPCDTAPSKYLPKHGKEGGFLDHHRATDGSRQGFHQFQAASRLEAGTNNDPPAFFWWCSSNVSGCSVEDVTDNACHQGTCIPGPEGYTCVVRG